MFKKTPHTNPNRSMMLCIQQVFTFQDLGKCKVAADLQGGEAE